jgi:chorismate dehydratase
MSSKSTTKTTLALIPYLNCEPFYAGIDDLGFDIVHEPPSRLGALAKSGVATCGPMAVADWFDLRDRYDLLGDLGIACEGAAHSVLLFAKRGIDRLAGCRVGLTSESSTSVRLLRLLLERKYGHADIEYSRELDESDAARLLIGDQALVAATEGLDGFPFVYDLGQEWQGWQALPFVFARWVVSKEISDEDRARIEACIDRSLDGWKLRLPEIASRRSEEFGLDARGVRQYLSTFRYRIGPVEALGEQTFEALLGDLS